ncbi:MAG: ABC transporter ATP-binding protein [Treponema sp.]|nr:ABC transporter ATP-binding protein [Treponema sp.]
MQHPPSENRQSLLSYLRPYVRIYARPFLLAVLFLSAEAACDLLQPTIMAKVIDSGVARRDLHTVLALGGLMLLVTLLGALAASGRNIISSRVSQSFGADLRGALYAKVQSFSFDDLDRFDAASVVTRLTNDVTQVQAFVNGTMRIFVKAPLLAAGGIVMAILLNARMAPVLGVVVPLVAVLILVNVRAGYPFFRRIQAAIDRVNGVMREYLAGVRVVKAFNRFDYETGRFAAANRELSDTTTRVLRVMAIFSPAISLTVNAGIVAVLWIGGYRVSRGGMLVGEVVAFVNYMTQILASLMMISFIFTMFARARASAERIGEVMLLAPPPRPRPAGPEAAESRAGRDAAAPGGGMSLRFERLSFAYGASDEYVLLDIDFSCGAGRTLGIIGSTGSGKTSLVNLIARFYEPRRGRILVDGIDAASLDPAELRSRIALVPQKTFLFSGSIEDNIRWGRDGATREEVEAAASAAQAHRFISLFPEGYGTVLGQGGVNLSGGQKQRIALARAMVRRPDLLILDDSTSAVDAVTEAAIRRALRELSAAMTTIVVAQRISSVLEADTILVLDDGEMVGFGPHARLMATCEVYRDIYQSQIGGGSHG